MSAAPQRYPPAPANHPPQLTDAPPQVKGVPVRGAPLVGGLIDSIIGILVGTAYSIGDAAAAILVSLIGG